ncbi:MAG: M56 family metallopeptidase, partial [Lachnospiraceae bacterium]|nr:M56 family metallopeptidase [Lachnospiraceae bacterium]
MIRMFSTVLNMSIASSIVILAVLLLRLFLKRAPRIFSYTLWSVVFLRLLCPLLPETNWGIIPDFSFIEAGAGTNLWTVGEDRQSAERLRFLYESVANEKVQIKEAGIETSEFPKTETDALMKVKGVWTFAGGIYFASSIHLLLYDLASY